MKNIINENPVSELTGRTKIGVELIPDSQVAGKDILDIGCGFGWFETNVLARGVRSVIGTEISANDLKTAKKYIDDPRARFEVGSAIKLDNPDNSLDTVVCWEVIEHIPANTEPQMFKEIHRTLRPGGHFYLSTPFASPVSTALDPAFYFGHRHYTRKQMADYAQDHGFELVECFTRGGMWQVVGMLNFYIAKWIFHRGQFFERTFQRKTGEEFAKDQDNGIFNLFAVFKVMK